MRAFSKQERKQRKPSNNQIWCDLPEVVIAGGGFVGSAATQKTKVIITKTAGNQGTVIVPKFSKFSQFAIENRIKPSRNGKH